MKQIDTMITKAGKNNLPLLIHVYTHGNTQAGIDMDFTEDLCNNKDGIK